MSLLVFAATSWVNVESPKAKTAPRFAGGRHVLISLARGPILESDTSQGIDAATWAAWQAPDRSLHLSLLNGLQSRLSPAPFGLEAFADRLDRISLTFDQNGRRVLAMSAGGTITVSRIIPGPTLAEESISWSGVDGLAWFDGYLRDVSSGEATDTMVFYLPASRDRIFFRVQSENFAVERTYLMLVQPSSLDHIALSQNRLILYVTDKSGLTSSVVSERYPLHFADAMVSSAMIMSGVDFPTVLSPDASSDSMTSSALILSGVDFPTVLSPDATGDSMTSSALILSGVDLSTVISPDASGDSMVSSAAIVSGADVETVIPGGDTTEYLVSSAIIFGGSIA
jgi:hypothetical protein